MSTDIVVNAYQVKTAEQYLMKSAEEIGAAKARLVKATNWLKHLEAVQFLLATGSNDVRKAKARACDAYRDAIIEEAEAAGAFKTIEAMRDAAETTIDVWRTQQASLRKLGI